MKDDRKVLIEAIINYCDDRGVCCRATSSRGPLGNTMCLEFSRKNKTLRVYYSHYEILQNVNWVIDQIKNDIDKLVEEAEQ